MFLKCEPDEWSWEGDSDRIPKHHLSLTDHTSFFKYQQEKFLSESRSGPSKRLNLVSKSGIVVSVDQAIILAHSQYMKGLVDAIHSCSCVKDVSTLLLPDEEHQVVQALVDLLSRGSTVVTGGVKEDLTRLMGELRLEIGDQLVTNTSSSNRNSNELPQIQLLPTMRTSSIKEDKGTGEEEDENGEQNRIIKKLSFVLSFLQGVKIKNDEMFVKITKPLEDILASLKYLPVNSPFDFLPTEIKKYILDYLCDSGVLIAGNVSAEWKNILNGRLISMRRVKIGKHCSNVFQCEEGKCFMPEEMLRASKILRPSAILELCSSLRNVDAKQIAEGLTSVSNICINNLCECGGGGLDPILTKSQMELFFETIDRKSETVNYNLSLFGLNMIHLDQDKLIQALLKLNRLGLTKQFGGGEPFLDYGKLTEKLVEGSTESKLRHLSLNCVDNYPVSLADALCQVPEVYLGPNFLSMSIVALKRRLIENILTKNIRMTKLIIRKKVNWKTLTSKANLMSLINKLPQLFLRGEFTMEQMEGARLLPGVNVSRCQHDGVISKGVSG